MPVHRAASIWRAERRDAKLASRVRQQARNGSVRVGDGPGRMCVAGEDRIVESVAVPIVVLRPQSTNSRLS
jgi:hypothetical protein